MTQANNHPGTVSRILWHFTGGPPWNADDRRQAGQPKPASAAYSALLSIVASKQLRTGGYRELVKVFVPERREYDTTTKKFETIRNSLVEIQSRPVCCLADIPIANLPYHAQRYGKFAIGFHRAAALKAGFNPVFYSLHNTDILQSLYKGIINLKYVDPDEIESAVSDIETTVSNLACDKEHEVEVDLSDPLSELGSAADTIRDSVETAERGLEDLLAFVKTFDESEFQTIYCEREWRAVKTFDFDCRDVAMVVLPRQTDDRGFFSDFLAKANGLNVPRSVPIIPWEDLLEY
jgi:hypothetical protein